MIIGLTRRLPDRGLHDPLRLPTFFGEPRGASPASPRRRGARDRRGPGAGRRRHGRRARSPPTTLIDIPASGAIADGHARGPRARRATRRRPRRPRVDPTSPTGSSRCRSSSSRSARCRRLPQRACVQDSSSSRTGWSRTASRAVDPAATAGRPELVGCPGGVEGASAAASAARLRQRKAPASRRARPRRVRVVEGAPVDPARARRHPGQRFVCCGLYTSATDASSGSPHGTSSPRPATRSCQQVLPRLPLREGHRPRHRGPHRQRDELDQPERHRRLHQRHRQGRSQLATARTSTSTREWSTDRRWVRCRPRRPARRCAPPVRQGQPVRRASLRRRRRGCPDPHPRR